MCGRSSAIARLSHADLYQSRLIESTKVKEKESLSRVGRTPVRWNQRILKKVEVSALEEAADGDVIVKRRNGRQATGE